jgi:hypothetical protein
VAESSVIVSTCWPYIERSLDRLVTLALEMTEDQRARVPDFEAFNSVATLVGHTLANAEDNFLGTLCGIAMVYDREADFEAPIVDAELIRQRWDRLRARVTEEIANLSDADVIEVRQHPRRGEIRGLEVLLVVARHAAEHLAQAEMTRTIVEASVPTRAGDASGDRGSA